MAPLFSRWLVLTWSKLLRASASLALDEADDEMIGATDERYSLPAVYNMQWFLKA